MSDNAESLAVEFHECMNTIYDKGAKRGFYPIRFLQMLQKYGGVETAKRLLAKKEIQARLMRLHELKLLDASMEAYVVQKRYHSLFTEEERAEARRRLEELGYFG